jgi:hypothetical protein
MKVKKTIYPENPSPDFNSWREEIKKARVDRIISEARDLDLCSLIELKREVENLLVNRLKK